MNPLANHKTLLSVLLVGALTIGVGHLAYAHGDGDSHHYGHHGQIQKETITKSDGEKLDKFYSDTKDLRRSYTQKRAEMKALMRSEKPDPAVAAKISGELFDLREKLVKTAQKNGIETPTSLRYMRGGMGGGGSQGAHHQWGGMGYGQYGYGNCNRYTN